MINIQHAYEVAASAAEAGGARETAAWLREQGEAVAELIAAGNSLAADKTPDAVRRWERARAAIIGGAT